MLGDCYVVANKFHVLSRDLNPVSIAIAEAEQASFHSKKKTNFFIHAKVKQNHNTCKHYRMSCLSFSFCRIQMFTPASKHLLGTPVTPDDFAWKQDNWVIITYLIHVAIETARVG